MTLLLKHGARPNAQSKSGLTAMLWAVHDEKLVRLLLRNGANPNLVSELENSPLIVAARIPGNHRTVRLLLKNGAQMDHENFCGVQALQTAAASGDVKSVELLLEQGAEVNHIPTNEKGFGLLGRGSSALMWAANLGDLPIAKLLVSKGADVNLGGERGMSPLALAAMFGRTEVARLLLQEGADVNKTGASRGPNSFPPLMWAASEAGSQRGALVELLLKHGANAKGKYSRRDDSFMEIPQTPLLWADRHGDPEVLKRLTEAGATRGEKSYLKKWLSEPSDSPTAKVTSAAIKSSIGKATPLLETTALDSFEDFAQRGQRCISCHQQMIPQLALADARNAGLTTDNDKYSRIVDLINDRSNGLGRFMEQPTFHPGASMAIGYFFRSLMAADVPADIGTDIRVHVLASLQTPQGYWRDTSLRQPIQSSDVAGTALAIRGLQTYPIPGRQAEIDERIERATNWLRTAPVGDNEDLAYQLMGLAWAGQNPDQLSPTVRGLLDKQRANGGWAQLDSLESDAYATGQSLYALITAGGLRPGNNALERGLQFLLSTQTGVGSWHVRRRAYPFQPTFDGAFPHGRDTWISASATSWAVMAMSQALRSMPEESEKPVTSEDVVVANVETTISLPKPAEGQFDFEQDIRPAAGGLVPALPRRHWARSRRIPSAQS